MRAKKLTTNLMVENVNSSIEFYKDLLGAEVNLTVPTLGEFDFAILKIHDVELMLQSRQSLGEEIRNFREKEVGGSITLYFEIEEVENFFQEVKDRVRLVQEMHETFYGTREFSFEDPNGYVLAFSGKVENGAAVGAA